MIEVILKCVGQLVVFKVRIVVIHANFNRTIGRKQLRTGIGLEPQHCLKQKRMPNLAHAFNRSAITRALQAGDLNSQAKELDSLRPILNPVVSALNVIPNAAKKLFGDAAQLPLGNVIDQIAIPIRAIQFFAVACDWFSIKGNGNGAIGVLDLKHRTVVILLFLVFAVLDDLNHDIITRNSFLFRARKPDIGHKAGCHGHKIDPYSADSASISSVNRWMPCCAAILSDFAAIS